MRIEKTWWELKILVEKLLFNSQQVFSILTNNFQLLQKSFPAFSSTFTHVLVNQSENDPSGTFAKTSQYYNLCLDAEVWKSLFGLAFQICFLGCRWQQKHWRSQNGRAVDRSHVDALWGWKRLECSRYIRVHDAIGEYTQSRRGVLLLSFSRNEFISTFTSCVKDRSCRCSRRCSIRTSEPTTKTRTRMWYVDFQCFCDSRKEMMLLCAFCHLLVP